MASAPSVLLLGIGNVLWADEGFGVRTVEAIHRKYEFPDNVVLMDGGTQGIYLIQHVQAADILVVFDAIDYGLEPGALKLIEGEAVPNFMGAKKMSLHQTGFQEVLAMARLLDSYPQHLMLIGVQPAVLEDFGGSLRPEVRAQIDPAIDAALAYLSRHDVSYSLRRRPLSEDTLLAPPALDINGYEANRPAEDEACRVGDERVLASDRYQVRYRHISLEGARVGVSLDHHLDKYR
jgi:hydrogenase maturation protease